MLARVGNALRTSTSKIGRLSSPSSSSICIFPEANSPLKKAACATVGIAAVGTGLAAAFGIGHYTVKYSIEWLDNHPRAPSKPQKYTPRTITTTDTRASNDPRVDILFPLTIGSGVAAGVCAYHAYDTSRSWYREGNKFRSALGGTECCDIVRATGRFSLRSLFYGAVIPASILCGGAGALLCYKGSLELAKLAGNTAFGLVRGGRTSTPTDGGTEAEEEAGGKE
jgi:hypothetical protein